MAAPSFEERTAEYRRFWETERTHEDRVSSVDRAARLIISYRPRYMNVEKLTGVPWFVVGVIHMREASNSFNCCLCNGERIIGTGRRTRLVPAGRGPYLTWEASALDELKANRHMDRVKDWSIERICYEVEAYNGWGYWWKGDHSSAYLWAGSYIDHGGKYVADHVFDANAQDSQNGAMTVLKRIAQLTAIPLWFNGEQPEATPATPPVDQPKPTAPAAPAGPSATPQPPSAPRESLLVKLIKWGFKAIFK